MRPIASFLWRSRWGFGLALIVAACQGAGGVKPASPTADTPSPTLYRAPLPTPWPTLTPWATRRPTEVVTQVPTGVSSGPGRLAYVSTRYGGDADIYVYDPHAWPSDVLLVGGQGEDTHPAFAPDGVRLLFVSDRDGDREIYLTNFYSDDAVALTDHPAEDSDPAWSPDGSRIAFRSKRDGNNELYILKLYGRQLLRLTDDPSDDMTPAWSPDGKRIAFVSASDGNLEIYVMSADGSDLRRVTHNAGVDGYPAWSPDGSSLAFHSERDGNTDIYVVDVDCVDRYYVCEAALRLTEDPADDMAPAWMGRMIVFMSARDGTFDLYETDARGLREEKLSGSSPWFEGFPSWGLQRSSMASSSRDIDPERVFPTTWILDDTCDAMIPCVGSGFSVSPYGSRVAFFSDALDRDVFRGLYVFRGNCSSAYLRECGFDLLARDALRVSWSPGGQRLAILTSERGSAGISIVDFSGADGDPRQAYELGKDWDIGSLTWSPDDAYLLFDGWMDGLDSEGQPPAPQSLGAAGVYLLDRETGDLFLLYPAGVDPQWSPAGSQVAFLLDSEIYTMPAPHFRPDGSLEDAQATPLTYGAGDVDFLAWSPDGRQIALVSDQDGDPDLYVMQVDGARIGVAQDGGVTRLISEPGHPGQPVWSPDGRYVAFISGGEIHVIRPDGTGRIRITFNPADEGNVVWTVDGWYLFYFSDGYRRQVLRTEVIRLP